MNSELPSIDALLRDGGIVVAASERAARSLAARFHRARRREGLTAWPSPRILDWQSFVRSAWDERVFDGRMVLSHLQEQSLWARIVAEAAPAAVALAGAADRLAALAMEAHHLLCAYAPQLLRDSARSGWDQDAGAFSAWLAAFNEICRDGKLISGARLPLELDESLKADSAERPHLLLAGFDRILPAQQAFFAAWGDGDRVCEVPLGATATQIYFHASADPSSELAACALWAKAQLAANPQARLLVVTQDARTRSEDPQLVKEMAGAAVRGFTGTETLANPLSVLACAKHYVGDGGTAYGSAHGGRGLIRAIRASTRFGAKH